MSSRPVVTAARTQRFPDPRASSTKIPVARAKSNAAQPRVRCAERRKFGPHGTVDDGEQIAGHRSVGLEAEDRRLASLTGDPKVREQRTTCPGDTE